MQKETTKLTIRLIVIEMNKSDEIGFLGEWMDEIASQQFILRINF